VDSKTTEHEQEGGTLGRQLRRARESRGVSLREISEQTRITMRHLEAIEADDYKHLPGGIFNRSFIKAYSRYVGFDEARALELYTRDARDRGEHSDEAPASSQRSRVYMGEPTRSPATTAVLSLFILGIFVLVVYAGLHYYRRTEGGAGAAPTPSPAEASGQGAAMTPTPQPTPTPIEGFQVQVRANGRAFWLTSWQDAEKRRGRFITPDKPEDFQPEQGLNLLFDRTSADALVVSVNGQTLRTPTEGEGKEITWTISKDNYRQFLP
jgi:transcriptional regulator with XRE-family HTH domain